MNNHTERIDQYLNGSMSQEEKAKFEKELSSNPYLSQEFEVQKNVMAGLQRAGIKTEFAKAIKNHLWQKALLKAGIFVVVTAVVAGLVYYVSGAGKITGKTMMDEKSKALETQVFQLQTDRDTVIETKEGLVFAVPAGAFKTEEKWVNLDIQAAIEPADIMKAGLSTTSDGKLLETAGMFYLNATDSGGKSLDIIKPIDASVPAETIRLGMMLFDGVMDEKGNINWVDPKPLQKNLVTYDIKTLDFYPGKYIPALRALGLNTADKKFTDSLYYSFSGYGEESLNPSFEYTEVRGDFTSYQGHVNGKLIIFKDREAMLKWADSMSNLGNLSPEANKGLGLFKVNCDNCHDMILREVAPPLHGTTNRHSDEWLLKWIKNNDKLRATGDKKAIEIYNENGKAAMNTFENLSDKEIKSIIAYLKEWLPPSKEIDPSRIRAIWDESFNNTILATREFEERLRFIFTTCNSGYLDLYVSNLDKPLYMIDSMCAALSGGAHAVKFQEFYKRKDGGVKVSDHLQKKLSKYFSNKYEAYKIAAEMTRQKYEAELQKLQAIADEKQREHTVADFKRESKNFNEEFCLNLVDAYRQLGQEKECPQTTPAPAGNYYRASITSPGWKNLDQYVLEATRNRESLEYVDETGKKAMITYSPLTITVKDSKLFDQLYAYLIPDSLSSFQRINEYEGKFSEKLNSLLHYDLFILGYKNKQPYIFNQGNIKPGSYEFALRLSSKAEMESKLSGYSASKAKDFEAEFRYMDFEQAENRRKTILLEVSRQREEIAQAIFPCYTNANPKPANMLDKEIYTPPRTEISN